MLSEDLKGFIGKGFRFTVDMIRNASRWIINYIRYGGRRHLPDSLPASALIPSTAYHGNNPAAMIQGEPTVNPGIDGYPEIIPGGSAVDTLSPPDSQGDFHVKRVSIDFVIKKYMKPGGKNAAKVPKLSSSIENIPPGFVR